MSDDVKIVERYLDYAPPVVMYRSLRLLLDSVPREYLAGLHKITLTNSAGMRKMYPGKFSFEKRRVRPADCRGVYGGGNIFLVMDQMFGDCPEIFLLFPPVKTYLIARTLYHEIGHHIHRLEEPGYRTNKETVADEWRDKLLRAFFRRRYWYFGLLVRACFKVFPSIRRRHDNPADETTVDPA